MKVLRVGDPHVMVSNLKDSQALMDFIVETALREEVDQIEFLGDQFHTHAVKRVEVEHFWYHALSKCSKIVGKNSVVVLVGNHDQPGSKEKEQEMNALNVFKDLALIVNEPMIVRNNIGYIPYMSDKDAFLQASADLYNKGATKLLVAHQTFTGATYENGFYAEDGIEPDLVHQEAIISGHIHKQQAIGKCFYPGTPKWDTMSDANEDKGIWIFNHNEDGSVKEKKFISTKDVVTPIYKHVFEEGGEEPVLVEGARNYLELVGKAAWITKMKKKYKGKVNLKARPTDRKSVRLDSDSLLTINSYIDNHFEIIDGVKKDEIKQYLESING
jgi:DNA repair exonuclease SbcCD nuclease subunit